jgi:uncharacterized protein (TIGR03086 family)
MDETTMKAVCDSTDRVVAAITADHYDLPTPCTDWNVKQLANHLIATLHLGRALLSDEIPTVHSGPGQVPAEDLVGDDLLGAYQDGVEVLVAATTRDAVSRVHVTPLGEMPGAGLAGFTALDVFVHGWDLAKATGQSTVLDTGLADLMFAFARQAINDESGTRAPLIGPEIATTTAADATSRLVAYLGRQP